MASWCAWTPQWMVVPCAAFSARWMIDDRAVAWWAGLPGVRRHRHAKRSDRTGDAGAAESVGEPVRRLGVCVPWPSVTVRFIMPPLVRSRAAGRDYHIDNPRRFLAFARRRAAPLCAPLRKSGLRPGPTIGRPSSPALPAECL